MQYRVIPDRIEAGTFMVAAAITNGEVHIGHCRLDDMMAVVDRLRNIGVAVEPNGDGCTVAGVRAVPARRRHDAAVPRFPDRPAGPVHGPAGLADGNSVVIEKIFPDRFMHVAELNRMAANLRKEGPAVIVAGVKKLIAAPVMASDLRASAALVLAGLVAEGTTTINRVYHIDRGYEQIEERLNRIGAKITREEGGTV